jgi:hypothetical protein
MMFVTTSVEEVAFVITGVVDGTLQKIVSFDIKEIESILLRNRTSKVFSIYYRS